MDMVLQTVGLTKQYGTQLAVQDLNMNVEQGKVYGLLGRNGAGKTTTIRMITGLLQPTAGEVFLFGEKMKNPTKQIFGRIGALIESPAFYENLTAKENLKIISDLRGTQSKNSIMTMALFTYILNLSGILIGVHVTIPEFAEGLRVYALAGLLMFLCILPVMFVSIIVKKGFLLSICISIVYALASFLASWVAPLAALLPIDVAWRIMDLQQFEMSYSFSMPVSWMSLAMITIVSVIGIFYVSKRQEA